MSKIDKFWKQEIDCLEDQFRLSGKTLDSNEINIWSFYSVFFEYSDPLYWVPAAQRLSDMATPRRVDQKRVEWNSEFPSF